MTTSPSNRDETPTPPEKSTVILLLKDIGNITWRMFAPLIIGVLIGWLIDKQTGDAHWGVLVGIAVGLTITVVLIRNVYKKL